MSRFFFSDGEMQSMLSDFGVAMTWIDPSGSMQGDEGCTIYGDFTEAASVETDTVGMQSVKATAYLTIKSSDFKQMRVTTVVFIKNDNDEQEEYRILTSEALRIDDGQLTIVPVIKLG